MRVVRPRTRVLVVAAVAVVSLGALAASGLDDNLVYYRTPTELAEEPAPDEAVLRVGGMVPEGSLERTPEGMRFTLTDGVTDVEVLHTGEVRGVFQEGQGALAEGRMGPDGVFRSSQLMVQHDNEYRGLEEGEHPSKDGGGPSAVEGGDHDGGGDPSTVEGDERDGGGR